MNAEKKICKNIYEKKYAKICMRRKNMITYICGDKNMLSIIMRYLNNSAQYCVTHRVGAFEISLLFQKLGNI